MASLIQGYEYDIFISYRQKDNKGDKWVSEFVDALKTELESAFKEEISVYFDINPHDGLLETHDVDASLKDKLKCLIFIPIISRTYCDPKSFAWEHEFKAFVERASQDQLGLKVKLSNGNVANRVLPVRIHDLDTDDIHLCESVLGGVLRGIDFIYIELGVNRPLKSDDDEKTNLNKTRYRNQINKVGNAIKEIISGLKTESIEPDKGKIQRKVSLNNVKEEEKIEAREQPAKAGKRVLILIETLAAILIFTTILAYPKIFKHDNLENLRAKGSISLMVLPFQNMSNDTILNIWQDGIQNNLITALSNFQEFKVMPSISVKSLLKSKGFTDYASITPSIGGEISRTLDADVFIFGSIIKIGPAIRFNIQLISSKNKEIFKSFQKEGSEDNIMPIIDTLSREVKDFLIISKLREEDKSNYAWSLPKSAEGYKYLVYGGKAWGKSDFTSAIDYWLQAIKIDSTIYDAYSSLAYTYLDHGNYEQGKKWLLKFYSKLDMMDIFNKAWANYLYAFYLKNPNEAIRYAKQMVDVSDGPTSNFNLGDIYCQSHQFDKAIPAFEKVLDIDDRWKIKPKTFSYIELGICYHKTGQYKKEKKLYKKAEQDFPDSPSIIRLQAILSLSEDDTLSANKYIEKYVSILKGNSLSETDIKSGLARIYSDAGNLDKAEKYYREALSSESNKPDRMNTLAYFLIDKDRNINQGLELVNKMLESSPDNYKYLDTKGLGLYKQGKYHEALDVLQRSWDLRMKNAICDPSAFFHLEEVKKAVANQKN